MKTAVDSRVILDVLAEITPALTKDDLRSFLADWNILFVPSSRESSILA